MRWVAIGAACAALASCENFDPMAERDRVGLTRLQHFFRTPTGGGDIRGAVLDDIAGAEGRVWAALSDLTDDEVAGALAAVAAEGVEVQVVTDESERGATGVAILEAAGIPIEFGNGELAYLPEPTITSVLQDCEPDADDGLFIQCIRRADQSLVLPNDGLMVRPDSYNVMTHNFFVIDDVTVWNLAAPLNATNTPWFAWRAHSQEMVQAFEREFRQMFGGTFSTTLTAFNGPNKSETHGPVYDSRIPSHRPGRFVELQPGFLTNGGMIDVRFNPQSRLVKELIDELYNARTSVFLMTDQLTNEFVIDAIAYKARFFDVRVVVREGSVVPEELATLTDIQGDPVVRTIDYNYVPTVMLTDSFSASRAANGRSTRWARSGIVLSHATFHGAPFEVFNPSEPGFERVRTPNDIIRIYPSDLFVDGSMWMFKEYNRLSEQALLNSLEDFVENDILPNTEEL
jgi:hypothetical protein